MPFTATLDARFETSDTLRFMIKKKIVESIIGGLLFHPDDIEGLTQTRALSLFRLNEPGDGDPSNPNDLHAMNLSLRSRERKRFYLLIGCVALGASFRVAFRMAQLVRDESGLGVYGGCSELIVQLHTGCMCRCSSNTI
jgi:hypothetical protein